MEAQRNNSGALAHLCFANSKYSQNGRKYSYAFRFSLQFWFETFFVPINIRRVTLKMRADMRVRLREKKPKLE
jgi:hypothetical protein